MNLTEALTIVNEYINNLEEAANVIDWQYLDDDDPIVVWMDTVHENHLSNVFMNYCEARYVLGLDDNKAYEFHLYVAETERRISRKQRTRDRMAEVYDSEVESGLVGV